MQVASWAKIVDMIWRTKPPQSLLKCAVIAAIETIGSIPPQLHIQGKIEQDDRSSLSCICQINDIPKRKGPVGPCSLATPLHPLFIK
jgi:hypothetical protein